MPAFPSAEAAAVVAGLVSVFVFCLSSVFYVEACEKCKEYAKQCKRYEMQMRSRNNPSMQQMANMRGVVEDAYHEFRWKRWMRSFYFVMQVLAGMTVLGVLIYLAVREFG